VTARSIAVALLEWLALAIVVGIAIGKWLRSQGRR